MYRKNTAGQFLTFQGVDATTGGIKSGVTWTVRRCLDGTFAAGGGTVTEDSTNGWYKYAMSQADTNGNNIAFNFTGSGAVPQTVNIVTTAGDPTDSVRFGLTALPNAAAEAAGGLYTRGTGAGQINQDANGRIDANVKTWIGGTIPAVNVTGVPLVDAKYLLGTLFSTPTVGGIPNVNVKTWNDLPTVALPLVPTIAGRTLDVSAGGEAGLDWANVGSPTTTLALTGTTIATTQKVDIETIKTNPVVNAGTITFPTTATLASTTNITAGTVTTATNVTTVNGLAAGVVTAAAVADGAIDRATFAADTGLQSVRSNTAQAGGATSITLDAGASATTDFYKGQRVYLTGGTGAGQDRVITAYNGSTKVATVTPAWATNPANDSTFAVMPDGAADMEAWVGVAPLALSSQQIQAIVPDTQKVDLNTIKTQAVTCAGGVTVPAATLASTTNITAGTVTTATNVTTVNGLASGVITATSIAADAITAAKIADGAIDTATFAGGTTIPRCTLVDTCTTNTDMRGTDSAALAATALSTAQWTSARAGYLDNVNNATLAAATFPATVASTTNITAGTITTVTNVTNAPTAGDFTAAMKTSIGTAVAASAVASVTAPVTLTSAYDFAKGTVAMTESYNTDGAAPTPAQALFLLTQRVTEISQSGTTITVKKLDGTTAYTLTVDNATTPTTCTRAT